MCLPTPPSKGAMEIIGYDKTLGERHIYKESCQWSEKDIKTT